MQQYFVNQVLELNTSVDINDEILFHLKRVLRKNSDYDFRLVDTNHEVFIANLIKDKAYIKDKIDDDRELGYELVLAMSLIKHDRFEWAIQKAVELGVTKIIPMITQRVVLNDKSENKRIERYKKIIQEAAEQSLRNVIPEITNFKSLNEVIDLNYANKLVAYEKEDKELIKDDYKKDTIVLIGPEGGFSQDEIKMIKDKGFNSISLGKRILRAETAACSALAIIQRGMEE